MQWIKWSVWLLAGATTLAAVAIAIDVASNQPGVPAPTSSADRTPTAAHPSPAIEHGLAFRMTFGEDVGRVLVEPSAIPLSVPADGRMKVQVVSYGSGKLRIVPGRDGEGAALRLPHFGDDPAAVTLLPTSEDDLAPEDDAFSFGAEFMSDGDWDDGDNLIQRGLFTDSGQYKIEIDGGRPACSIKGTSGRVTARSRQTIEPGTWYAVDCSRDRAAVTIILRNLETGEEWSRVAEGATGNVEMDEPAARLSIGGKTWPNGTIGQSPDQFNGVIDNVYLRIGSG